MVTNFSKYFDEFKDFVLELSIDNLLFNKSKMSSASIDLSDPFVLDDIQNNEYFPGGIMDKDKLYNDIKRVYVGITGKNIYFLKSTDGRDIILEKLRYNEIKSRLDQIILYERKNEKIRLSDILLNSRDKRLFEMRSYEFISDDPKIFSIFRGFPYKSNNYVDMESIQIFINHMKEIICSGDGILFKYLISWIAYIIQNPGKRTDVCLILMSELETGKILFTDIICKLFGSYCNSGMHTVARQFNSCIENKMLVILNEINMNKRVNPYNIFNVSNFIIVSNSKKPITIEKGDRRYVVFDVSKKRVDDRKYFKSILDSLNESFYTNLFNYFRTLDIADCDIRDIPITDRKRR